MTDVRWAPEVWDHIWVLLLSTTIYCSLNMEIKFLDFEKPKTKKCCEVKLMRAMNKIIFLGSLIKQNTSI